MIEVPRCLSRLSVERGIRDALHSRGEPQCISSTSADGVEFANIEREKGVDLELSQGTGKAGEFENGNLRKGKCTHGFGSLMNTNLASTSPIHPAMHSQSL